MSFLWFSTYFMFVVCCFRFYLYFFFGLSFVKLFLIFSFLFYMSESVLVENTIFSFIHLFSFVFPSFESFIVMFSFFFLFCFSSLKMKREIPNRSFNACLTVLCTLKQTNFYTTQQQKINKNSHRYSNTHFLHIQTQNFPYK